MGRLSTIPPEQPFVDALARGVLAQARSGAFGLHDALILLPTRRACRAMGEAFLRQCGANALLLPQIQPIGDVDADELLLAGDLDLALPPPIGRIRRQLMLARLLGRLQPRLEHALRLAEDLIGLLDEVQTERVALAAIEAVVPDELAEHWQNTREILACLAREWPEELAREGALEPAERRHLLLEALAQRWRRHPPDRRIVAAGTTGSIPATRLLLRAILAQPAGEVVLPGLDRELDEPSWQALEPTHPQYGLKQLLDALGVDRREVATWRASGIGSGPAARVCLLREVMRPAAAMAAGYQAESVCPSALEGLTIEEHPDLAGEALAIALRMRAALEQPGRTAALVTPDRQLARRVAAELRRWQVEVDDSAGTPLDQTPPGAFLLLTARLITEGVSPVALLAVLKHPFARMGRAPAALRGAARDLELACLRGPRLSGGFPAILNELNRAIRRAGDDDRRQRQLAELRALVDTLAACAGPFSKLAEQDQAELDAIVEAHVRFAEALAADERGRPGELWAREAGEAAASLLLELREAAAGGHRIPPASYPAILALLMASRPVRPRAPRQPRLFIWGQLEARLQHADLVLLGGLNEGSWPATIDPGPWLNRAMREGLGLSPPERRIGLAAHDFAQLAAAPEVVLTRAERDAAGSPTVPSRWLVRLQTILEAAGAEASLIDADGCWRDWARALDDAGPAREEPRPRPCPPVAARPRRLSVSDIGTWMKNPYELYARRILKLQALDPLEADPGALERGTIIHRVLERFVRQHPAELPQDAEQQLLALGRQAFEEFAHRPQVMALWWPRFERVAQWVICQERQRRSGIAELLAEVSGELEIDAPAGPFVLKARADRIERHPDGRVTIIDYKTGRLPERREVLSGEAPQLPLEAVMIEAGCFRGVEAADVAGLRFWRLKGDESGGEDCAPAKDAPVDLARAALEGLIALIAHYDREETPYPARPRPRAAAWRGDYDHLARLGEWSA